MSTDTVRGTKLPVRRIYGLDMIRGAAVFLVLLRHAWPDIFGGAGIVGVVMFFALSGYLITGILVRELSGSGRINLARFYIHRFFRLVPPLAALVLVYAIVQATTGVFGDDNIVRVILVSLTYTANIPFDHGSPAIGHLWTLATEEQFYLVWPFILLLAFRVRRLRTVVGAVLAVAVAVCLLSVILTSPNVGKLYTLPTSWASAMILGALVSVSKDTLTKLMPTGRIAQTSLLIVSVVILGAFSFLPELKYSPATYLFIAPAVAVMTVVLIFHSEQTKEEPRTVAQPLVGLGRISYAAYLWNYPVVLFIGEGRPLDPLTGVYTILVTVALAVASWYLVEQPSQTLRRRLALGEVPTK